MSKFLAVVAFIVVGSAFTVIISTNWAVKEEAYAVKFDTRWASGTFKGLKGAINFDATNLPKSGFDVTVDVSTISTGNGLKNSHAKSEGFFNAAKFPTIQFTSSKIEKTGTGFQATGKLRIKDVTKDVLMPFTFVKSGDNEGTFKSNFEINRLDYGLERKMVGEIVKIELLIPVKK